MSKKEQRVNQKLDRIALDKVAVNEAINEWLERKWKETLQKTGLWTMRTLALLIFTALIIFVLHSEGWHKP